MMNQQFEGFVSIPPVSLSEEPVTTLNCISPLLSKEDHQQSMPGSPSIKRCVSNIIPPADMMLMDASDSVKLTETFKSSGKEGDVFADNYRLSRLDKHAVAMDTVAPSNNDATIYTKPDNNGKKDSMTCISKEIPTTDYINDFKDAFNHSEAAATMDTMASSNNDNSHLVISAIFSATTQENYGKVDSMTCISKEIPKTDETNDLDDAATMDTMAPPNDNSHTVTSDIFSTIPDNNGRQDSMTSISKEIPKTDDTSDFEDAATMDTVAPSSNDNSHPVTSAIFPTIPDNNGRQDSMTSISKEFPTTDDTSDFEDAAIMDTVAPSNYGNSHPVPSGIFSTILYNNCRQDSMTSISKEIPTTDDTNDFEDAVSIDTMTPSNNDNSHPVTSVIFPTIQDNNGRQDSVTSISKEILTTDDTSDFEDDSNHSKSSGSSESIVVISDSEPEEDWARAHGPRHIISTSSTDDMIRSIITNNPHQLPPEEYKPVRFPSDDDPPAVAPPNDGYIPPSSIGDLKTDNVTLEDSGIGSKETENMSELEDATTHSEISETDSFDVLNDPEPDEIACTSDTEDRLISTSISPFYELYLLEGKKIKMVLMRENVYEAFQNFYRKDISFLLFDMEHEFISEPGEGCGLTKEAFTLFHEQGRHLQYGGDIQLTPQTSGIESKVLARVIYHEFRLTRQFPSFLCTAFVIALITRCNIREYGKDYLMKSFINCVLHKNKAIFLEAANNGIQNMSLEYKNILFRDISMEIRAANLEPRNIDEGNWQEALLDLAHFVLIEKPSCREVIEEFQICMSIDGIPLYDMDEARKQVENTDPTAASILLKLKCVTQNEAEEQAKGFLYRFIGSYFNNRDMAERFVVFCTSSTSLPVERIEICFNAANGLSRAVRAHTCGNLLHVPTTYSTYREFRDEFLAILSSKESLVFGFQ